MEGEFAEVGERCGIDRERWLIVLVEEEARERPDYDLEGA